jgi:hypothetical protein
MAQTVDTVRGHVNGVTAAVAAMETAVIAAELNASKTICENVDKGFYVLMKSQLSQKAVAAYTEMTGKQAILLQLARALDNVRQQMQGDFNMICRRYQKLFQSLNKALETRIRELDRPAMKMAEVKKQLVFDKLKNESSLLFSAAEETLSVSQAAAGGKLKQKTSDAIKVLYESAVESRSYNDTLKGIFISEAAGETPGVERPGNSGGAGDYPQDGGDVYFLPAIFSSTESLLVSGDIIDVIYTAQTEQRQNSAITAEFSRVQGSLNWTAPEAGEKETIKKEFLQLFERDDSDERTGREIMRLFEEDSWEVLKNEL